MLDADYAKLRLQALEQAAGASISPLTSPADLIGTWDMRFARPFGSDEVQGRYIFREDGTAQVDEDTWQWTLHPDGTLSLIVPVEPMPEIEGLEDGGASEELRLSYKTADGRLLLSNDDTSVIELLTRASGSDVA